ncbi:MAG: hypothetical protein SWE60_06800 [Thermodesulfobacteriota bacterium]|nr:hypothetical protein [Thermodesulfobacteriota bacterium]
MNISLQELKKLVFRLPTREFLSLAEAVEKRSETMAMMRLSETGFREWNEAGEDIYDG